MTTKQLTKQQIITRLNEIDSQLGVATAYCGRTLCSSYSKELIDERDYLNYMYCVLYDPQQLY